MKFNAEVASLNLVIGDLKWASNKNCTPDQKLAILTRISETLANVRNSVAIVQVGLIVAGVEVVEDDEEDNE